MKTILTMALLGVTLFFSRCTTDDVTDDQLNIIYPDSGAFGINILDTSNSFSGNYNFSFSAKIPEKGDLAVRITKFDKGNWYVDNVSVKYWTVSVYDPVSQSQTFSSSVVSNTCDLHLEFRAGKYLFEFFENEDANPTFIHSYCKDLD